MLEAKLWMTKIRPRQRRCGAGDGIFSLGREEFRADAVMRDQRVRDVYLLT